MSAYHDLTVAEFRALARVRLAAEPRIATTDSQIQPLRGDHDLNDSFPGFGEPGPVLRPAAVLVPVIERDGVLAVILTQRPDHMTSHAGQVAFPGGKIDRTDASPLAAALREAEEEIGLAPHLAEPLGYLDVYQTGTGYRILPVVALVASEFTPRLNPSEVADCFEVPLAFLIDRRNHRIEATEWRGRLRRYYDIPFGTRRIWGVTAGMVRNLSERLDPPC
ncbi:MAG: CoA pyrophosphatase [Hyphomicrobiaceae bacterium]